MSRDASLLGADDNLGHGKRTRTVMKQGCLHVWSWMGAGLQGLYALSVDVMNESYFLFPVPIHVFQIQTFKMGSFF